MQDKLALYGKKAENINIINIPENFKLEINIPGISKKKDENRENNDEGLIKRNNFIEDKSSIIEKLFYLKDDKKDKDNERNEINNCRNKNNNYEIKEGLMFGSKLISLEPILISAKSICKIEVSDGSGTGFLIKLSKREEDFFCLITNEHVVTKNLIKHEDEIKVYYDNTNKSRNIKLSQNERIIREFTYVNIDATVIEILPEDNIDQNFFLVPNIKYMYDFDKLSFKKIAIIQYPKGKFGMSFGKIKNISNFTFSHSAATLPGSSGSPIFLKDTTKVIGIHKSYNGDEYQPENYGDFIGPIYKYFKEFPINPTYKCALNRSPNKQEIPISNNPFKPNNINNNSTKKNSNSNTFKILAKKLLADKPCNKEKKIYYEDGSYYIGQVNNDEPNGKGSKYDKNGRIKYKGDFINGKMGGNGQYYFENGDYYIGQMKNDLIDGYGKIYYMNGSIKYDGNFVNGHRHDKGIRNDMDGNIKYKGSFVNGKKEGN